MKQNSPLVLKALPILVLSIATLAACSSQDSPRPRASAPAPGTLETSESSGSAANSSLGSYQGPIVNTDGEIQAVMTLDVWDQDGQRNAQLTLSPGGASSVISIDETKKIFAVQLATSNAPVTVQGTWNGSTWTGAISNGKQTNSFVLNAGASSQAAVAIGTPTGNFDGVLIHKEGGGTQNVSLILSAPTLGFGDAIATTLTSNVALAGVLKFSANTTETLTNVVWDRETSTLSADGTIPTSLGLTSLRCKMNEVNAADKDVLQCALSYSKQSSPIATGALSQKRVVVAPPYLTDPGTQPPTQPNPVPQPTPPPGPTPYNPPPAPVPTAPPVPAPTPFPVPVPTPSLLVKNERVFSGSGIFTNEQGAQQTRTLTLTVTLNADPSGADQEAVVKFIIDCSRVGAKFTDATYNSATGELKAKEILNLGPIAGSLKLSCGRVPFASNYNFLCHYESSVTNVSGEFHLQGSLN